MYVYVNVYTSFFVSIQVCICLFHHCRHAQWRQFYSLAKAPTKSENPPKGRSLYIMFVTCKPETQVHIRNYLHISHIKHIHLRLALCNHFILRWWRFFLITSKEWLQPRGPKWVWWPALSWEPFWKKNSGNWPEVGMDHHSSNHVAFMFGLVPELYVFRKGRLYNVIHIFVDTWKIGMQGIGITSKCCQFIFILCHLK